jgi:uncharacterized RDD family membrane protein YckC
MIHYYILEDGEQTGPFTFDEVMDMGLEIHTRVLSSAADDWQDACDMPEFFDYFEAQGIYFPTLDNLASFWWRLLAFLIDYVILSFILQLIFFILAANGITFNLKSLDDLFKLSVSQLLLLQLISSGTLIIYNAAGEASAMKGSIGKRVCRMVVVDADGVGLTFLNALARSFGKVISLVFWGLGFLSIFFTEHRQAVHDLLAKTYVVKL